MSIIEDYIACSVSTPEACNVGAVHTALGMDVGAEIAVEHFEMNMVTYFVDCLCCSFRSTNWYWCLWDWR